MPCGGLARNNSHQQKFLKLPSNQLARTPKSAATLSLKGSAALLSLRSIEPKRNGVSCIG
jgi:hypothetical protein